MPIFEQGYQHWDGELRGHTWRWLAVTKQGIRTQMGGWVIRILLILAWLPALVMVVALALWGLIEQGSSIVEPLVRFFNLPPGLLGDPVEYRTMVWTFIFRVYYYVAGFKFSMIMVAIIGPGLISKDLRYNAMPLYLSRPLRRRDYLLGKLGVIVYGVSLVSVVPPVAAYIIGALFTFDAGVIADTYHLLFGIIGYGLTIAVTAGVIMLAFSSLTKNSSYIVLFWVGFWFIADTVVLIIAVIWLAIQTHEIQLDLQQSAEQVREIRREEPATPEAMRDQKRRLKQAEEERDREREKAEREIAELGRNNWFHLLTYSGNIDRLETSFLGTDSALDKLAKLLRNPLGGEADGEEPLEVTQFRGPRDSWHSSAGVLLGLMAVSGFILNRRVRSLDRLK